MTDHDFGATNQAKVTIVVAVCIAAVMVAWLFWRSKSNDDQMRAQMTSLAEQMSTLENQLQEVSQWQFMLEGASEQEPASSSDDEQAAATARRDADVDNRMQNQRRANDNQWQRIDQLKSQSPKDLLAMAEDLEIENASTMHKGEMMFSILKERAEEDWVIGGDGVLEVLTRELARQGA